MSDDITIQLGSEGYLVRQDLVDVVGRLLG